jgi:hypothetical protein
MAAKRRRPARRDRADDSTLDAAKMSGVSARILLTVTAQDVGDLDRRPVRRWVGAGHDQRRAPPYPGGMTSSDRRSNGLCVARIVRAET